MFRRLTTEEFISKARLTHGDKYDYSKIVYVNNKTKVCIVCPEHGEFLQMPSNHLNGSGCPKCDVSNRKKNVSDVIAEFEKVHGDKYDYSKMEYRGKDAKICIICKEHGEFWQTPSNHIGNHGCPRCKSEKQKSLIYGFGVNDYCGEIKVNNKHIESYLKWRSLISRCYNENDLKTHGTYRDVKVCDEWKYFSNFKEWFDKYYIKGWSLDKDILCKNNREYTPDKCCFVPNEINTLFRRNVTDETKRIKGREYAEKYKSQLDERVYNALINY